MTSYARGSFTPGDPITGPSWDDVISAPPPLTGADIIEPPTREPVLSGNPRPSTSVHHRYAEEEE